MKLSLQLETVSPLFLYGANQGQPELRAASVRGQLRYWFRAMLGANTSDLGVVRTKETALFGSTEQSSVVTMRVWSQNDLRTTSHMMLPHRENSGNNPSKAVAIDVDQTFTFDVLIRPGSTFPGTLRKALVVWLLVGGLGKRSRRTFGALQIARSKWNGDAPAIFRNQPRPKDFATYVEFTNTFLIDSIGSPAKLIANNSAGRVPDFPTLHPQHSRVVVCAEPFGSAKEANQALFRGLLRRDAYLRGQDTFGYAARDRRASPLTAQVRRIGDGYHLVLTAMRSNGGAKKADWALLSQFMQDASEKWDGVTVWGEL